ncbi:ribonucleoside-diphosphate reductase small chain, putative [Theileria equi strain WA]|uniref:Ribonucleoside-diphosphate reductase small chain, putative n=1 Tax=Theileria equi strain WA TaxID=1537102 RepID=L1LG21_THEEQ|nr:ribonucleoside-diphosphate reductase small chain, putative [Theileria equi strain WA]EKX74382.1 ribonucleoside-diphosphate reductase small chain, putative [Theileria equi strain WA]|eukprot:XP_004833834.1 ribonucleoside-diphosphate reductase small chain, putative [Theileria equi strain WA]
MALRTVKHLSSKEIEGLQANEIVLKANPNRWVMFPIKHDSFWAMYKEVENNFWAAEDFIFSEDKEVLDRLDKVLLDALNKVLSYHIMLDNNVKCRPSAITLDLLSDVQVPEARAFYGFQLTDENIHSETVGSMFQTLAASLDSKSGSDKISWLHKNVIETKSFFKRVLLMLISKLVFSASFGIIRDFIVKEKIIPTYALALDAIESDQHIHARFAFCLFELMENRMLESEVLSLINEVKELEIAFCLSSLPLEFMKLQKDHITSYVESRLNQVLLVSGYKAIFKPDLDVDWINEFSVDLNIQLNISKPSIQHDIEHFEQEIKFDEDF